MKISHVNPFDIVEEVNPNNDKAAELIIRLYKERDEARVEVDALKKENDLLRICSARTNRISDSVMESNTKLFRKMQRIQVIIDGGGEI